MQTDVNTIEKIEQLVRLADGKIVEIDGRKYATGGLSLIQHDPQPQQLDVSGLQGIVDFIHNSFDKEQIAKLLVSVVDPNCVIVYDSLNPETMKRKQYARASIEPKSTFNFGAFLEHEFFLIGLKANFKKSKDQESLLSYASKVTQNATLVNSDDGISQSATVSKGMSGALRESVAAPSIVTLKPYRTFREIDQPESEFIFRMRPSSSGDKLPSCALFEADGGAWKLDAIKRIAEWIKKAIDVTVIA